jgi:hypothetical protein
MFLVIEDTLCAVVGVQGSFPYPATRIPRVEGYTQPVQFHTE